MYQFTFAILAILLPLFALANVEKTIFIAPPATLLPSKGVGLDDLGLERLSPEQPVVRSRLNASFPSADAPEGTDSWFFLENLRPGQRYEVRVCWLATQPTAFSLTTHPVAGTIEDVTLLSSLSIFSNARLAMLDDQIQANAIPRRTTRYSHEGPVDPAPMTDSALFLRVRSAADYFSVDEALMRDVPPVAVDLILDPFLWNVFPRSLVPTAGWIVVVTIVAVVTARWVANELGRVIDDARRAREAQGDKKAR